MYAGLTLLGWALAPIAVGQTGEPSNDAAEIPTLRELGRSLAQRPERTDPEAARLISRYLDLTGAERRAELPGLYRAGTVRIGLEEFSLEDWAAPAGDRRQERSWKEFGQPRREATGRLGGVTWQQTIEPREKPPASPADGAFAAIVGSDPFAESLMGWQEDDRVFAYQGTARVRGRLAHLVVLYRSDESREWLYFDRESGLLTRHGFVTGLGGTEVRVDRYVTRYVEREGVILEARIELAGDSGVFETIEWRTLEVRPIAAERFQKPYWPVVFIGPEGIERR